MKWFKTERNRYEQWQSFHGYGKGPDHSSSRCVVAVLAGWRLQAAGGRAKPPH